MKIACGIATLIFVVFTVVQFNDFTQYNNADWWSWVVFYVVTAAVSFAVGWKFLKSVATVAALGGFALGSFVFRMQDEFGNFQFDKFGHREWFASEKTGEMVQQTNEAGGLLMVALWVFILAFLMKKQQGKCEKGGSEVEKGED